jgi:hypothetical protein
VGQVAFRESFLNPELLNPGFIPLQPLQLKPPSVSPPFHLPPFWPPPPLHPVGVLVGLLALGESMPTSHWRQLLRLISWVAILIGVSSLAGGRNGKPQGLAAGGGTAAAGKKSRAMVAVERAIGGWGFMPEWGKRGLVRVVGGVVGLWGRVGVFMGFRGGGSSSKACEDDGGPALPTSHVSHVS